MRIRREVTRILKHSLRLPQIVAETFTDIRTTPSIPLADIILTVCLMPLLEAKSLLRLDFYSRLPQVKRLFAGGRGRDGPVCSDTTLQRVMRWLSQPESRRLLERMYCRIKDHHADQYQLYPGGPKRRIVVGDGSVMGAHHICAFSLVSNTMSYPFMIEGTAGAGHELSTAKAMIPRIPRVLGDTPDLLLYDYLGFTSTLFEAATSAGMHVLVKGGDSQFRDLLADARALFDAPQRERDEQAQWHFDLNRLWCWRLEETSGTFADIPVRVARLVEYKAKDQASSQVSWIVTTDFSLSPQELREAAHVRWSIENNVFKKLSGLVATKRFHFTQQRPFVTLLRVVCAALAAYDLTVLMMDHHAGDDKGLFGPVKRTYGILYLQLFHVLEDAAFR